ncbi:hypothetical protein QVD17_40664 [Tagetes erecta]|uniref:Uncharacterized protein n=1 Tax=Tagetes erecta TaxID=13708 RepID=A0AAD8JS69_TARER|nr:hypothetical protein QVD17_40664 [Tagetes erecta]
MHRPLKFSCQFTLSGEDIRKLENLITGMHYRHKMDVNELLNYLGLKNLFFSIWGLGFRFLQYNLKAVQRATSYAATRRWGVGFRFNSII